MKVLDSWLVPLYAAFLGATLLGSGPAGASSYRPPTHADLEAREEQLIEILEAHSQEPWAWHGLLRFLSERPRRELYDALRQSERTWSLDLRLVNRTAVEADHRERLELWRALYFETFPAELETGCSVRRALEADPTQAVRHQRIAAVLREQLDDPEGPSAEVYSDDPVASWTLEKAVQPLDIDAGVRALERGDLTEAAAAARAVLALRPEPTPRQRAEARYLLGRVAMLEGRSAEAIPLLESYFLQRLRFMGRRTFFASDNAYRRWLAEWGDEEELRAYHVRSLQAERHHRIFLEPVRERDEEATGWPVFDDRESALSFPNGFQDQLIIYVGRSQLH